MPVVRIGTTTPTRLLNTETRASLLGTLKSEIASPSPDGPVIFEIPMGSEFLDILVVWKEWLGVRSEDRSALIFEAYSDKQRAISQALGVTYDEAMRQQLLPYSIVSLIEENETTALSVCQGDHREIAKRLDRIRNVKHNNGGIVLPDGSVELRFPDRAMAISALQDLLRESHELYWTIAP